MKYFVRDDSGIRTPKDLEGKTVGFNSFGACAEFVTKKYLRQQGVDVDRIKWVVVPDVQAEQTLATGNIDLAIIHPPTSGSAEHNPALRKLWSDFDLDEGPGGMAPYSAHGRFLRDHPEAARDVVQALAKAANWVNGHSDDARKITAERLGMKLELVGRFAYVDDLVITEPPIQYYIGYYASMVPIVMPALCLYAIVAMQARPFLSCQCVVQPMEPSVITDALEPESISGEHL